MAAVTVVTYIIPAPNYQADQSNQQQKSNDDVRISYMYYTLCTLFDQIVMWTLIVCIPPGGCGLGTRLGSCSSPTLWFHAWRESSAPSSSPRPQSLRDYTKDDGEESQGDDWASAIGAQLQEKLRILYRCSCNGHKHKEKWKVRFLLLPAKLRSPRVHPLQRNYLHTPISRHRNHCPRNPLIIGELVALEKCDFYILADVIKMLLMGISPEKYSFQEPTVEPPEQPRAPQAFCSYTYRSTMCNYEALPSNYLKKLVSHLRRCELSSFTPVSMQVYQGLEDFKPILEVMVVPTIPHRRSHPPPTRKQSRWLWVTHLAWWTSYGAASSSWGKTVTALLRRSAPIDHPGRLKCCASTSATHSEHMWTSYIYRFWYWRTLNCQWYLPPCVIGTALVWPEIATWGPLWWAASSSLKTTKTLRLWGWHVLFLVRPSCIHVLCTCGGIEHLNTTVTTQRTLPSCSTHQAPQVCDTHTHTTLPSFTALFLLCWGTIFTYGQTSSGKCTISSTSVMECSVEGVLMNSEIAERGGRLILDYHQG